VKAMLLKYTNRPFTCKSVANEKGAGREWRVLTKDSISCLKISDLTGLMMTSPIQNEHRYTKLHISWRIAFRAEFSTSSPELSWHDRLP
jgi:hypothetical protein